MPVSDLRWAAALFVALTASGAIMKGWWTLVLSTGAWLARLARTTASAGIEVETGSWAMALSTMAVMIAIVFVREIAPDTMRLDPAGIAAVAIVLCQVVGGFLLLMAITDAYSSFSAVKVYGCASLAGALAATIGLLPMLAGSLIWWAAFRYIGPPHRAFRSVHANHS